MLKLVRSVGFRVREAAVPTSHGHRAVSRVAVQQAHGRYQGILVGGPLRVVRWRGAASYTAITATMRGWRRNSRRSRCLQQRRQRRVMEAVRAKRVRAPLLRRPRSRMRRSSLRLWQAGMRVGMRGDDYYAAIPLDTSEAVDVDESILQPAMRSRGQSRTQSRSQSPRGGGAAGSGGGAPSAAEAKAVVQPKLPSKRIRSAPAIAQRQAAAITYAPRNPDQREEEPPRPQLIGGRSFGFASRFARMSRERSSKEELSIESGGGGGGAPAGEASSSSSYPYPFSPIAEESPPKRPFRRRSADDAGGSLSPSSPPAGLFPLHAMMPWHSTTEGDHQDETARPNSPPSSSRQTLVVVVGLSRSGGPRRRVRPTVRRPSPRKMRRRTRGQEGGKERTYAVRTSLRNQLSYYYLQAD